MRTPKAFQVLALLTMVAGCGPEPAPITPPPPVPPSQGSATPPAPFAIVPDPQGVKRISADVTFLASPELAGRGTGEPGAKLAADFIAKRFADLKLVPLGDKGDKGQDYLQSFQARVGAKVEPAALSVPDLVSKAGGIIKVNGVVANGSADGEVKGKTVFVGYGITAPAVGWDDYAGADLTEKIAIVLDGVPEKPTVAAPKEPAKPTKAPTKEPPKEPTTEPTKEPADPHAAQGPQNPLRDFGSTRYKIRTAREHKAAGVILVRNSAELPPAPVDASSMGIPAVVVRRDIAAKFFPSLGIDKQPVWEVKKPARPTEVTKPPSATIESRIKPVDAEAWNVVAMHRARAESKTANEYVVVGAHYDHLGRGGHPTSLVFPTLAVHPGADDNASGAAMLLEVARRMSSLPRGPARNIIFIAFSGEELGVLGSRHWVEHPPVALAQVTAMINADMVGRLRGDRLLLDGTGTAARWPELAKAAADGLGFNITYGTEGFGASDHTSFTASKIPVAFLFTGVHDDYHRPTDTADKINTAGEERIATLAARLALGVAEAPERLAFIEAPADPNRSMGRGFKVSLGTVPDYAYTGKGVKLSGVRPDAPASRAGIQAGDTIVKVGSHEITNMHDYMFALGELEPGREVLVEVERAGKRIPVKLIPAPGR